MNTAMQYQFYDRVTSNSIESMVPTGECGQSETRLSFYLQLRNVFSFLQIRFAQHQEALLPRPK